MTACPLIAKPNLRRVSDFFGLRMLFSVKKSSDSRSILPQSFSAWHGLYLPDTEMVGFKFWMMEQGMAIFMTRTVQMPRGHSFTILRKLGRILGFHPCETFFLG